MSDFVVIAATLPRKKQWEDVLSIPAHRLGKV